LIDQNGVCEEMSMIVKAAEPVAPQCKAFVFKLCIQIARCKVLFAGNLLQLPYLIWAVLRRYAQRFIHWSWSVVSLAAAFVLALAPPIVGKVAISISM
jgi:hypothetical protein